jgi:chemotaxis methyl-accepting protein methylase
VTTDAGRLTTDVRGRYLDLVDRHFGIRGSDYGAGRMDQAVSSLLPHTTCTNADALLEELLTGNQPGWLDELVEHLTVGETYFLRDPAQVAALRQVILPEILERRLGDRRIRVWSAGCSTGEEPYTLAILLHEQTILDDWGVLLVGTDVNRESLRIAREATYPAWSFRATSEQFRQRYFEPVGMNWRLTDSVRRMVRFGWSNLAADPLTPPSADFDLIACRNVTIYFDEAATQRLYRTLVAALAPGGWLVLGPSDPLPADRDELDRVETHNAVFWRRRVKTYAPQPRVEPVRRAAATAPRPVSSPKRKVALAVPAVPAGNGKVELEAGLLALEAGSSSSALEWLRRATFRDPHSPLGQFALARAYLGIGDGPRAHAALLHSQRLLVGLPADELVADSEAMTVETLRQAVHTHLCAVEGTHA